MGNAAYNRGSQVISNQIAADRKRRENISARNYQEVLRVNQETIGAQATEIAQLKAELERAKMFVQLRKAERDVAREELNDTQIKLERMTEDRNQWRKGCIQVNKSWQKLSGIVRLALAPEEYHRYREIYNDR